MGSAQHFRGHLPKARYLKQSMMYPRGFQAFLTVARTYLVMEGPQFSSLVESELFFDNPARLNCPSRFLIPVGPGFRRDDGNASALAGSLKPVHSLLALKADIAKGLADVQAGRVGAVDVRAIKEKGRGVLRSKSSV